MSEKKRRIAQIIGLIASAACIVAGVFTEEYKTVLGKAVRICLECIGLGAVALVLVLGTAAEPALASSGAVIVCDERSCQRIVVEVDDELEVCKGEVFLPEVTFSKESGVKVRFESENKKRVKVTKDGKLKGKKVGSTTVNVIIYGDGVKGDLTLPVTVNVKKKAK